MGISIPANDGLSIETGAWCWKRGSPGQLDQCHDRLVMSWLFDSLSISRHCIYFRKVDIFLFSFKNDFNDLCYFGVNKLGELSCIITFCWTKFNTPEVKLCPLNVILIWRRLLYAPVLSDLLWNMDPACVIALISNIARHGKARSINVTRNLVMFFCSVRI